MLKIIPLLLLLTTPALAQQPLQPPQLTPSQLAISVTNAVNQMAVALDQLMKENADLKKQLGDKSEPPEKK